MSETDQITVCPECDSARIHKNVQSDLHGRPATQAYYCRDCGERFDDAHTRTKKSTGGRGGLAGELADPDSDLDTDGGSGFVCELCQTDHDTRADALRCCDDRFDDDLDGDRPAMSAVDEHGSPTVITDGGWVKPSGTGGTCIVSDPDADLPRHMDPCECEHHDGLCRRCGNHITIGTEGTEYGHAKGYRSSRLDEDCPHRPASVDPGNSRVVTDGGSVALPDETREWIEGKLLKCAFVDWDRFTVTDDPKHDDGLVVTVYGWIDREDDHEDFVNVEFWDARDIIGFTTSSDEHTERLHTLLTGRGLEEHNECHRVEHTFDVPNAIEMTEQTTLTDAAEASFVERHATSTRSRRP